MPTICGRRQRQRRHLRAAFLGAWKVWGLVLQVCVYAARDLTLRSGDIIWPEENSLGKFGKGGGRLCVWFMSSHKGKKMAAIGAFHKLWYFSKGFFLQHLGQNVYSAVRVHAKNRAKISKIKNILKHLNTLQTLLYSTTVRTAIIRKILLHSTHPVIRCWLHQLVPNWDNAYIDTA